MRPLIYIMTPVLILTILLASRFVTWDAIKGMDRQAQLHVQEGTASLRSWKLPQAIKAFTRAIEIEPRYAEAYVKRGLAYYRSAQYDAAIADYTQTLKLKRYQADAYASRGNAYQSLGDMQRAIEDYSASLKRRRSSHVIQKRAETYFKKGDVQKALADYDDLIRRKPTAMAYYGRGNVYLQLAIRGSENRLKLALADLDQAIALEPSFASAYISRAQVHRQFGDHTLASRDTRQVNRLLIEALDKQMIQALTTQMLINYINAL
ncbi:tetratricopeptide repeat protein [Candidatus Poribacteria bacterium]|nr:tetratricopeptide repeat protein [Candidatus Poribacteria bacterium]MYA69269.1 tetratricopeptide repeat protein [Candidatus Poribacteria bacterium]MYH80844.1 tetratricopeptide repeat protein [Candidatus Poribacteria bacterium]MYK93024.1 tetratricopeptide repeat protein [Candidatus Poribacteria bacterium]